MNQDFINYMKLSGVNLNNFPVEPMGATMHSRFLKCLKKFRSFFPDLDDIKKIMKLLD